MICNKASDNWRAIHWKYYEYFVFSHVIWLNAMRSCTIRLPWGKETDDIEYSHIPPKTFDYKLIPAQFMLSSAHFTPTTAISDHLQNKGGVHTKHTYMQIMPGHWLVFCATTKIKLQWGEWKWRHELVGHDRL